MVRNLHITIHEAARAVRRRISGRRSGGGGWDPADTEYAPPEPTSPDETQYAAPEPTSPGETQYAAPEPTSPGETQYAAPEPTSPGETEYAPPEPTSPEGLWWAGPGAGYGAYGAYGGAPGVTVHEGPAPAAGGCCCCSCAAAKTAAARPELAPRDYSGFVIVRLRSGVPLDYRSLWELAGELGLTALEEVLRLPAERAAEEAEPEAAPPEDGAAAGRPWREPEDVLVSRPLIDMPIRGCENATRTRCEVLDALAKLEDRAAGSGMAPLHSLAAYWRVDLRPYPELVDEAVAGFARLAQVDLAYRELSVENPADGSFVAGESFSEDQAYLEDAPVGIGAGWAWKQLPPAAQTLTVCDLEMGWSENHQEIDSAVYQRLYYGANRAVDASDRREGQHGNAVLGQLAARGGPYGIEGAAARVASFALSSHYRSKDEREWDPEENRFVPHPFAGTKGHVAAAIANALAEPAAGSTAPPHLREGDVLLLEVQRALLPAEIDAADFDAVRLATALGITVVEAAGNGGRDLDRYVDPDTGRSLNRGSSSFRDSGAIVVGAARAALPHDRAGFSNYGSRVDCFGWGEGVTSCGYGDLAGTAETDLYTNTFSGTSSASPIVAGAAALVQALYWSASGQCWIKPLSLRKVLSDPANGTRQGPNAGGHIGIMPDLGAIVRHRLGVVADVYMRRFVGDGGGRAAASVELGSSPDVVTWDAQGAQGRFGDRILHLNTPAPGRIVRAGEECHTYVRLLNRGGGFGDAEVELYESAAATLITPERWRRIGDRETAKVPQGDVPVLVGPWTWKPGATAGDVQWPDAAAPAHSLLAVLRPPAPSKEWEPEVLPPGPPYFDWREFRRFLRGPRAAWRNAHRVAFSGGQQVSAGFYIAGAPDRGRTFDLQVIERLPAGATVSLLVPKAFAQKLRQRQSWLGGDWTPLTNPAGWSEAALPARSRLDLGRLELACGARIPAVFRVTLPQGGPPTGHSLAVRQLWRGEEVGRITWWFIDVSVPGIDE